MTSIPASPQGPGDDLCSTIVAIETRLGDHDSELTILAIGGRWTAIGH